MRLLSIAVLATLPIAFGTPIQLVETTEVANVKRNKNVAAIFNALLDSNSLIARDGGPKSDVMKRRGVPGGDLLDGLGGSTLSAADLAEIEALLGGVAPSKRGSIIKRQNLLGGLLGSAGLGDLLGGLLGGGGGASAAPPSPAVPAPANPPNSGTYGNAPPSGGDPSPGNSGSSPPGNGGNDGNWPPSSGGPGSGGSGGDDPGNEGPGTGWPGNGWPGNGGPGNEGPGSGSGGGYTSGQPPGYGGGK